MQVEETSYQDDEAVDINQIKEDLTNYFEQFDKKNNKASNFENFELDNQYIGRGSVKSSNSSLCSFKTA